MTDGTGLKNRGHTQADVDERRAAVAEYSGADLDTIAKCAIDPEKAAHNCENMIGSTQVPLGFAGPVKISGEYATDNRRGKDRPDRSRRRWWCWAGSGCP